MLSHPIEKLTSPVAPLTEEALLDLLKSNAPFPMFQ